VKNTPLLRSVRVNIHNGPLPKKKIENGGGEKVTHAVSRGEYTVNQPKNKLDYYSRIVEEHLHHMLTGNFDAHICTWQK
jgi:hypothetical protein